MAKSPPDPSSVRAKIERARQHLETLHTETETFLKRDPAPLDIRTEETPGPGKSEKHVVYAIIREDPPPSIALIAGDAIQNARHALDHLVYELSPPKYRKRGKTQFPVFTDECEFKVLAPPYIKGIVDDDWTLIERLQPYHAPDPPRHPLAVLNRLANKDKHRLLLATAAAPAETDTWISSTNATIAIQFFNSGPVEHDAEILGFTATPEDPALDMYVQPNSALEIQIKNADLFRLGECFEIRTLIEQLIHYVEYAVIDRRFKHGPLPPLPPST